MSARLVSKISKMLPQKRKDWSCSLTKAQQAELQELRRAFHDGSLQDASGRPPLVADIYKLVCKEFGDVVSVTSFREWLRKCV